MLTPTTFGLATDVYVTLPQASGLQVGMVVQEPNDSHYRMLVQYDPTSVGNLPIAAAVKFTIPQIYRITATVAVGDFTLGANDQAGVVIVPGQFFWITVKGPATILVAAGIGADTVVNASATAGTLAAAGGANQYNIQTASPSGAGGATACWIN